MEPDSDSRTNSYMISTLHREMERVDTAPFELEVDEHGRVQLPTDVREKMIANHAGPLIAQIFDGELRLITPKAALRKVRRLISQQDWGTDSGVDQLILERRVEALRDHAESLLPTSEW